MYIILILRWSKSINNVVSVGDKGGGSAYAFIETDDAGFLLAGLSSDFSPVPTTVFLKYDSNGGLEWVKSVYTGEGGGLPIVHELTRATDGAYMGAATDGSTTYLFRVVVTSSQETSSVTSRVLSLAGFQGSRILTTAGGDITMGGITSAYGAGSSDVFVAKLDGNGDFHNCDFEFIFFEVIPVPAFSPEIGEVVVELLGGEYDELTLPVQWTTAFLSHEYACASAVSLPIPMNASDAITSSINPTYMSVFGDGSNSSFMTFETTADDGYIIFSNSGDGISVFKASEEGAMVWENHIDFFDGLVTVASAISLSDGSYLAVGTVMLNHDISYHRILVLRIDSAGDIKWSRRLGGFTNAVRANTLPQYGISATELGDGSIVVLGHGTNEKLDGTSRGGDVILAKYSTTGALLKQTFVGSSVWDKAHAINTASDGDIVIVGDSFGYANEATNIWIAKISSDLTTTR